MTIQAIETRYAGCRFRSRLEARWAVFFDSLGIRWEYEPQGFRVVPCATCNAHLRGSFEECVYLPDFRLPEQNVFFEVKGVAPDEGYEAMLATFSGHGDADLILAVGDIPNPDSYEVACGPTAEGLWMDVYFGASWDGVDGEEGHGGWDNYRAWCACASGAHFGIEYMGYGDRINCGCPRPDGRFSSECHPKILAAYNAARSARFEHGERG